MYEAELLKEPPSELVCRIVLASQGQSGKEAAAHPKTFHKRLVMKGHLAVEIIC